MVERHAPNTCLVFGCVQIVLSMQAAPWMAVVRICVISNIDRAGTGGAADLELGNSDVALPVLARSRSPNSLDYAERLDPWLPLQGRRSSRPDLNGVPCAIRFREAVRDECLHQCLNVPVLWSAEASTDHVHQAASLVDQRRLGIRYQDILRFPGASDHSSHYSQLCSDLSFAVE